MTACDYDDIESMTGKILSIPRKLFIAKRVARWFSLSVDMKRFSWKNLFNVMKDERQQQPADFFAFISLIIKFYEIP